MYYLFTHNDLDGIGCGIVARCAFGDNVEIRYNSVDSLNPEVHRFLQRRQNKRKKNDTLFITDLSVHEENAGRLSQYEEAGLNVKLIDHHKSSLHLNQYPWANVRVAYDDGRLASATSLFFDYLSQQGLLQPTEALTQFVELIRQYDTWEWEANDNPRAIQLNHLFFMTSLDEFEEDMTDRMKQPEGFAFTEFEQKLLELEEEKIERYIRRKRRELVQTFIDERCVGIVHAENYHSELSSELGKENPHLDYIAILNVGGRRMSLRTIHDEVDVSEIAGQYGGGGHAKASGCTLTAEAYAKYVHAPFGMEPIRPDANRNRYNVKGSDYGNLYEDREAEQFYIFSTGRDWRIDHNGETLPQYFGSFREAERFVKRDHQAWLVRDEAFVKYLMEHLQWTKKEWERARHSME
ncbi:oligoribonuclease [Cohnella pontilimi]|uniref:Oligoribonuclease n=1 Tax=Cohnella pontilimi TaxID=2564100 RepID=A0A4V5LSR1_9BACL|nr:DHH family phosphoesterase [Cohnella pontilimi]TJY43999.1 oligoribonuclease [Cohnella pontilimi]